MSTLSFRQKKFVQKSKENKPTTLKIDARCKEVYYSEFQVAKKESAETLKQVNNFWNYMTNVSMQNAVVQMTKNA